MTLDWLKRLLQRGCCTSYSLTSTHDDFEFDEEAIDLSAESFPNALESGSSVVSEWQEEALRCKIEQDPKNWQTHYYLGSVLVEQEGKFEEAERHLKIALLFNPYHVESYFSLAYSYHEQGNFSKAIQTFLIALKLDGRNAELWTGLGSAYKADQQLENAFGAYRNAIAIDPLFTMPYYNLGNLYYEVGDTEHAITLFMQCLRIDPSHTDASFNLAVIYRKLGDKKAYEKYKEMAASLEASNCSTSKNTLTKPFQSSFLASLLSLWSTKFIF